jgi:hypothetical protein
MALLFCVLLLVSRLSFEVLTLPFFGTSSDELKTFWAFQSIDTMKYSRDLSREKLHDSTFDAVIELQVRQIAETGATHVAIATPYDAEFLPILKRWVAAARREHLKVWFRGNWSGWEGWFNYPKISRATHLKLTQGFILKNADLFEDGDIFTSCPECENGGSGDPRSTGDVVGYRAFLIQEFETSKRAFADIGKTVTANYFSMNGDVARLVMDRDTTTKLGGVVTIDHYVATPDELVRDVRSIAAESGGKIVLGEFGAPIPDLQGYFSEADQAMWIRSVLQKLANTPEVIGVNYWVNVDGSTALWSERGVPRSAVSQITNAYTPQVAYGFIKDELDRPVGGVAVTNGYRKVHSQKNGFFELPMVQDGDGALHISALGYRDVVTSPSSSSDQMEIMLTTENKTVFFHILEGVKQVRERFFGN